MSDFYSIGESFIEEQMIDECEIYRDAQGVRDDVLNEDTGELVPTDDDETLIYGGGTPPGKCLIKAVSAKDMSYDEGDLPVFRKVYNVMMPQGSPHVEIGDRFVVVSSSRDSTLTGQSFRVMEQRYSTHATYRFLRVEDVQQDFNSTNPAT